jgi:hypothetical protein
MDARFRIRTREGEEIAPRTVEIFSELVRSGAVRPEDLVFDALTGEWVPASVHPMVRLFQDPLALEPAAESLALKLVEPDAVSPEEEARAFIARMEEERRSDPDLPALSHEVPLVNAAAGAVVGLVPDPAPPDPAPPGSAPPDRAPAARLRPQAGEELTPTMHQDRERSRPPLARYGSRGWVNAALLGGAVVALILSVLWPPAGSEDSPEQGVARADGARAPSRAVPMTEEQTRALAFAAFLDGVDALRDELGVGEVPRIWLEGRYLADPVAYPEVRRYWERYLAFVDAARASEVTLYRGAYLTAAADAGLAGPVRSLRLAAAQEDFAAARGIREDLYGRVEGLARAALALDNLLVEMKGRVTWEPIAGPRVSADPVIEAVGADADAQMRLEAALDRVLAVLQGPGGVPTRDRAGVPLWLVEGLSRAENRR